MIQTAEIRSEETFTYSRKICGLYPLERNIIILSKAGIKKIFLNLSEKEASFYKTMVERHLKTLKNIEIIIKSAPSGMDYLSIQSNLFIQACNIKDLTKNFIKKGRIYKPAIKESQFLLYNSADYKKAEYLERDYIIKNTGGFIAQKINKRISIPISLFLVNFRIHPNYLTILNMIIGLSSGLFLLLDSYLFTVLGGFLFQTASIMDGVDGEVAKFTFKVSRIGGWLDTISDNSTLIFFLSVLCYLFYANTGGLFSIILIVIIFIGITAMIGAMVRYLRRYSKSGSLVAYDREFLQKLPQNDPFVIITQKLKYFTKKELFSIVFFAVCLTGRAYLFVPVIALVLLAASVILVIINKKYLGAFKK